MSGDGQHMLWFEPVSTSKAGRASEILQHLDFVSPNASELIAMAASAQKLVPGVSPEQDLHALSKQTAEEELVSLLPYAKILLSVCTDTSCA